MNTQGIVIPIRALADLSGVSNAFNRLFSGQNSNALRDYQREMARLRDAIKATGQASRNIGQIRLDPHQYREELRMLTRIRQEMEAIARTPRGHQLRNSLIAGGYDWRRPWEWNRGQLMPSAPDKEPGPSPMRRLGSWGLGTFKGGFGMMAGMAGAGSLAGLAYTGYQEHKATIEGVDSIFKALGSSAGFQGLMDDVRQFGKELQIAGSEASRLAEQFVRASGAANAGDALTRASEAGQFGRGYGLQPGATAELFARSSLVGYGGNRQTQRDFASMLATTISGSGMFARSEQVMGDLVGKIEDIATREGRTASTGEIGNFASMLREMFKDPALRGGGAHTLLNIGESLGGEGGPAADALAYAAYGAAVGNRMEDVKRIQQANPYTPIGEIAGIGEVGDEYFGKTRAELAVAEIRRQAREAGMSEEFFANQYYNTPGGMQQYRQYADYVDRSVRYRNDTGYQNWMANEVGTSTDLANPSGMNITTDIYEHRGSLNRDHMQRLAGYANEYLDASNPQLNNHEELREELRRVMQDGGDAETKLPQLQEVLAKIAAQVGGPLTDADRERKAKADLLSTLGGLGDAIAMLTTVITDLLVPPLKLIADLLKTIIDLFRPNSGNTLIDRVMRGVDDGLMQSMKDQGMVDENEQPTDRMDAGHRRTYETIMRHRRENPAPDQRDPNAPAGSSGANPTGHTPDWMRNAQNSGASQASGGYENLALRLARTESDGGGGWGAHNNAMGAGGLRGHYGRMQFGRARLAEASQALGREITPEQLMADPALQRQVENWHFGDIDRYIQDNRLSQHIGTTVNGEKVTLDGMRATAHLGGKAGLKRYLESGGSYNPNDGRTSLADYMRTHRDGSSGPSVPLGGDGPLTASSELPSAPANVEPEVPATVANVETETPAAPANVAEETPAAPPNVESETPAVGNQTAGSLTEEEFRARYAAREREQQGSAGPSGTTVNGISGGQGFEDVAKMKPKNPLDTAQPPRTPPEVAPGGSQANAASVNGSVAVNINVAKDGRPLESSAHQLSFGGEPRVYGSGGSQPSRVEWSRTV